MKRLRIVYASTVLTRRLLSRVAVALRESVSCGNEDGWRTALRRESSFETIYLRKVYMENRSSMRDGEMNAHDSCIQLQDTGEREKKNLR
jgi:hypothetical protein